MSTPKLGYWGFRGLGEPIRYLLHFKGVTFEDKRYTSPDAWQKEKFNLDLDFPNLPYYIDDKVKLTQSNAILRHLARKYDLLGQSEEEQLRVELAEQQLVDFRMNFFKTCFDSNFENIKEDFVRNVPTQLKLFSKFLGDRNFFAGDRLTYVDFIAYDTFDFYWLMIPGLLNEFPNLKSFIERFEKLPELQAYIKSSTYSRWPITPIFAFFGNKGTEPKRV